VEERRSTYKHYRGPFAGGCFGFGSALAMVISWSIHQSILLAIFHGVLSWCYVIYYAIVR